MQNLNHPNVHTPWSSWSEDQRLYLVVPYSNPFRWQTRRKLFNDTLRHLWACPNIVPVPVELAYGDRPFEVTDPDMPNVLQLRTECELWHKENLINVACSRIPSTAKYAGYCDADFHMTRYDFGLEAIHMLQHYHFVQLISSYTDLTAAGSTSDTGLRPYRSNSSFAWNYLHQTQFLETKKRQGSGRVGCDPYYGLPIPKPSGVFPFGYAPGAPGGAWAWNCSSFDAVGGLLDTCILGSADWHMAFGLIDAPSSRLETEQTGQAYNKAILDWQKRASQLKFHYGKAPMGCVDNYAVHFFHGSHRSRGYGDRWQILVHHDFDPGSDVHRDRQGIWRWTGNKPALRDEVRRYFVTRDEDQSSVQTPSV